jgi:hypothetical protein
MNKFALLLSFLFMSCGAVPEAVEGQGSSSVLDGVYSSCMPSQVNPGTYENYNLVIARGNVSFSKTIDYQAECTAPYMEKKEMMRISNIEETSDGVYVLTLKLEKTLKTINDPFYVQRNYCGDVGWQLGVAKDVSGISCPSLLERDSHRNSYRDKGDEVFIEVRLTDNSIRFPVGYNQSGESFNERKTTPNALLLKK